MRKDTLINVKQEPEICKESQHLRSYKHRQIRQTNVNYVAFSIYHDVSVVSVLNLENITGNRVRSHRLDEVQPSLLEGNRMFSTVFSDEEIEQVIDLSPPHFIS